MNTIPNYTETEVKLYVPDLSAVQARLEQLGAVLAAPRVYERNVRYEDAQTTLTGRGIVVRLRQDSRVRLTYKESGQAVNGILSRYEAEVEVSDFDTMQTILGKLGYTPHFIYEKYRTTYTLDGCEVVLDELPYGNFVEIEGDADTIPAAIQRLSLDHAPHLTASYTVLFERVKQRLGLACHDLTFENFKGVAVSEEALVRV